ncbi:MAG: DNA-binding protein WhiA [Clostridium sp.]|nr:DNA-binding protein WhiA [Clostridium sp.]MCM1443749.1 DNA-binding protein WhiA [Candidatus Amulumruptor caecigallinarius]
MSFTGTIKLEITNLELTEAEKISEFSAIVSNSCQITDTIKISTENMNVAKRIYDLIKSIYKILPKITVRKGYNYNKSYIYILELKYDEKKFLNYLGLEETNIPFNYIIADDNLIRAYLRGVFLSCGSINDPKKSRYHMEFFIQTQEYAIFINDLLNHYYLNSKILKRDNKYMVYVKEAEKIGDFLRIINASKALFYYEDIRIYRDHRNMTNRLNNCEQANVDKIIETSSKQLRDIKLLKEIGIYETLSEKDKIAAEYREKYKEASLSELSEIISIETNQKITKSGLHHRYDRIKKIAEKNHK